MTLKAVCRVVMVNAILLFTLITALELVFGSWIREDSLNRLNLIRNRTLRFTTSHLYSDADGVATYTRDRYGIRGSCGDPSNITMLTVGGSTTDQRYVSDHETWQSVLQTELLRRGKHICIGNAGVDGQSTIGHLKNFEWWFPEIPRLRPRYIVFYVGINDFYTPRNAEFDDLTRQRGRALWNYLREHSATYHLAYTLYANYQSRIRLKAAHGRVDLDAIGWTNKPLQRDHSALTKTRLHAYRTRLLALVQLTRSMGAQPILVTQPTRWHRQRAGSLVGVDERGEYEGSRINGLDRYLMMRLIDKTTCSVAEDAGLPCIDLGAEDEWADGDFYDFVHMTPKGTATLGVRLARKIEPLL
ncbi:MAG: SGNH/GDSL hydrolase family protein [Steroidobacteraceae bacterium]